MLPRDGRHVTMSCHTAGEMVTNLARGQVPKVGPLPEDWAFIP